MKCATCESRVNDGARCGGCNRYFGFCCASISEVGYRKLGTERRENWRCSTCKSNATAALQAGVVSVSPAAGKTHASPVAQTAKTGGSSAPIAGKINAAQPQQTVKTGDSQALQTGHSKATLASQVDVVKADTSSTQLTSKTGTSSVPISTSSNEGGGGEVTLISIMSELKDVKRHLLSMTGLVQEVKEVRSELTELKVSCEFTSAKMDDFGVRLSEVEKKLPELNSFQDKLASLESEITTLKQELSAKDQWSRLNNVEIKGIPTSKNENLFAIVEKISKAVDYSFPKTSINYISRVPMQNSKEKAIIVSFTNRYVKEDFVASARTKKILKASEIGFETSLHNVYVNDHLTPDQKKLLTKTKTTVKARGYLYVWVKYGKIHVRKNDTTQVFVVHREGDLNKLF